RSHDDVDGVGDRPADVVHDDVWMREVDGDTGIRLDERREVLRDVDVRARPADVVADPLPPPGTVDRGDEGEVRIVDDATADEASNAAARADHADADHRTDLTDGLR